jgi:hypothetical protein
MKDKERRALGGPLLDGKLQSDEVVLVMDLGAKPHRKEAEGSGNTKPHVQVEEIVGKGGERRWCISVRGHGPDQYPCLREFSPTIHKTLRDPEVDLPRKPWRGLNRFKIEPDSDSESSDD